MELGIDHQSCYYHTERERARLLVPPDGRTQHLLWSFATNKPKADQPLHPITNLQEIQGTKEYVKQHYGGAVGKIQAVGNSAGQKT